MIHQLAALKVYNLLIHSHCFPSKKYYSATNILLSKPGVEGLRKEIIRFLLDPYMTIKSPYPTGPLFEHSHFAI